MKKYEPLQIGLIDEGRFIQQTDADLGEIQKQLLAFCSEYAEKSVGAKAKLTIEVTVACEDANDGLFSLKSQTKMAFPARPASTTMAIPETNDDGSECLFVRKSGSDSKTPRQGKLCTDEGRSIPQTA